MSDSDKTITETAISSTANGNRIRHWLRVLRPFGWWLILVLVLFAVRTHQRLSEQTRLAFTAELDGHELSFINGARAMVDGHEFESGQRIPIGWHSFTLSHPKGEPFTSNLFVWYGPHDFGQINLKRAKGILEVHANPPAQILIVRGSDFHVRLTNSAGMTSSVPTDSYMVEAKYRHWEQARELSVTTNLPGIFSINGRFGTVQMMCNQSNASFQILKSDAQLLESGEFPATIPDVPEGEYKVVAWHHRNQQEQTLRVKADITNTMELQFLYGAAVLESEPIGAVVTGKDGREWGYTPLRLAELPVGRWQFNLNRDGYERVMVDLEVVAEQTATFTTNLVGINYAKELKAAREFMAVENYEKAEMAATAALQAKPNDADALAVYRKAYGQKLLAQAKQAGQSGDYITGVKELKQAVQEMPDNEEARQLLADFKLREPEQIERMRVERLERPNKVFASALHAYKDADLFDRHELKTSHSFKETESAIVRSLEGVKPAFRLTRDSSSEPETFRIEAQQEVSGGIRKCVIAGGQTKDDETLILFEVLEYQTKSHTSLDFAGGFKVNKSTDYLPVNATTIPMTEKLQSQLKEGVQIVTERIERAVQ